jgi:hypothetical protein
MHLLIPFAAISAATLPDEAAQVWRELQSPSQLPNLSRWLACAELTQRDEADDSTLSPPHERALAATWGWQGADGSFPFAAQAAAADGIDVQDAAWGLVTPVHWQVGREHVTLADPEALRLTQAQSRTAFEAVRELFESAGFRVEWGSALRWYIAHESLANLPCAALDRAVGRNVEWWLRGESSPSPEAKFIRRLQSELQLLLYTHPLNDEREQLGELSLNSFWLSGCGRAQSVQIAHRSAHERAHSHPELQVVDDLRAPMLAQDWLAWAQAWRKIDSVHIAPCVQAVRQGRPVTITLCGERNAHRFEAQSCSWWQKLQQRWKPMEPRACLEAL